MRTFLLRLHIGLGTVVALPMLAWSISGLMYAWPNAVEGGQVEVIDAARVPVSPSDAMARANAFTGKALPITALTLTMRDGRPVYQAIGGMGADSLLIDAQTAAVIQTPAPGIATRFFRQAHFYFFAGRAQVPLLVSLSGLASLSALSGIYLLSTLWRRDRSVGA